MTRPVSDHPRLRLVHNESPATPPARPAGAGGDAAAHAGGDAPARPSGEPPAGAGGDPARGAVDGALALAGRPRAVPEPGLRAVAAGERAPLTEASPWLRTLAQAIAEALTGCRAAEPLRSVVTYDVYMTICRGRRTFRTQTYRPQLWRLRTCTIGRDHVEVAAVVRFGAEYRALALRLDRAPRGWRCTVLRVG